MLCPQMADEVVNIGINHPAYKVCRRSCPPTRNPRDRACPPALGVVSLKPASESVVGTRGKRCSLGPAFARTNLNENRPCSGDNRRGEHASLGLSVLGSQRGCRPGPSLSTASGSGLCMLLRGVT